LGLRIVFFTRAANAHEGAVPAGLIVSEIAGFLQVDFPEPFDVRHAVPARHNQTHGKALGARQRLAIKRIRHERFLFDRILESDAPAERLFQFKCLAPEHDLLFAAVQSEENNFPGFGLNPDVLETLLNGTPVKRPQDASPCIERLLFPEHS